MDRRNMLHCLLASGLGAVALPARASPAFPVKPVTFVVAFSPGGGTDALIRAITPTLSDAFGQSFIVENRPGAGAIIGSQYVAKATPDGYTLLVTSVPHVTNPSLVKSMSYDTVKAFSPICLAVQSPFILIVPPTSPITSLGLMVELAKKKKLFFGSSGNGTADHLGMELFCSQAGISMSHVAYKGTGPAMLDLMGGHIDLMFANVVAAAPLWKGGKVRAIATSTARRSPLLPQVQTIAELSGRPFDVSAWTGILAPAGTDPEIVALLGNGIRKSLQNADVRRFLAANGADIVGSTPAEFQAFIEREIGLWAGIIRSAGISVN